MVDGNKAVAWTGPVNEDELQVEKLGTVQRLVFGDDFETDNGRAGSDSVVIVVSFFFSGFFFFLALLVVSANATE